MSLLENSMSTHQKQLDLSSETIKNQQQQFQQMAGTFSKYVATDVPLNQSVGVNYIRYGHKECPNTATIVYEGFMGKSWYSHTGGGSNYLCLPRDPDFLSGSTAGYQSNSYVYGVEYAAHSPLLNPTDIRHHDAVCAVCEVKARSQKLMIPGKNVCPSDWTEEYQGLLMAERYLHSKSDYICVDFAMEKITGGSSSQKGGFVYVAEAVCGSLPCPPYDIGYEITCIVCTK